MSSFISLANHYCCIKISEEQSLKNHDLLILFSLQTQNICILEISSLSFCLPLWASWCLHLHISKKLPISGPLIHATVFISFPSNFLFIPHSHPDHFFCPCIKMHVNLFIAKVNVRFMDRSLNVCKTFNDKINVRFMDQSLNASMLDLSNIDS